MHGHRSIPVLAVITALALSGCAAQVRITYIPEGGTYTAEDLSRALDESDPGPVSRVEAEDVAASRQETLADLRTHGEDASRLADVLTSDFPSDTTAVPYAVELATFEGEPAWIVFEAWGDPGEPLSHRRVWVFSRVDQSVLAADSTL